MTRTSSLEVSIKTHIDCTLNNSPCFHPCFVCVLTAPPVNNSVDLYYCTHGCVCQLDIKENGGGVMVLWWLMQGWRKGVVFVNGFNVGRYWDVGPQRTLYVPAPLMRLGLNQVHTL